MKIQSGINALYDTIFTLDEQSIAIKDAIESTLDEEYKNFLVNEIAEIKQEKNEISNSIKLLENYKLQN